jgi:hypothetical protein
MKSFGSDVRNRMAGRETPKEFAPEACREEPPTVKAGWLRPDCVKPATGTRSASGGSPPARFRERVANGEMQEDFGPMLRAGDRKADRRKGFGS